MLPDPITSSWTSSKKFFFRYAFVFIILFIPSFSFEHEFLPDPGKFIAPFFESLAAFTGKTFFNFSPACTYEIQSDTIGFYLHALNLFVISLLLAFVWTLIDKNRANYQQLYQWFFVFIRYYLAMQLFSYGFNKIFKWQFYLPEPNTLYTTIGNVPRDFLYWSSMGTSRLYVVFSGIAEIIPPVLLLFRRTYIAGAVVALFVMLHVLTLNLGFNISVKLYSAFLLLLCIVLLIPEGKKLVQFFFSGKTLSLEKLQPAFSKRNSRILLIVKISVIAAIILDPLSLYIRTNNYNDDLDPRPPLHGAYEVKTFVKNSDTLLPLTTDEYRWRRMFVHRRDYLILQQMNDEMMSFELFTDTVRKKLMIKSENAFSYLNYTERKDSTLHLDGIFFGDTLHVELEKVNLKTLPLLQDDFEWAIDE